MNLPQDFTIEEGTRKVQKIGHVPSIQLQYKGVTIALFIDDKQLNNLHERVGDWIKTYGYLAEWIRQKFVTGQYQNWTDDMFVDVT